MRFRAYAILSSVLAAVAIPVPSAAQVDSDETCYVAYRSAQLLRRDGKLRAAERDLIACSQATCPGMLRKDCLTWIQEVRASTPSIVVTAVGPDGCDLDAARVAIDDESRAEHLDGRALAVDPGRHRIDVELTNIEKVGTLNQKGDRTRLNREIVVAEGEHDRRVVFNMAKPGAVCGVRQSVGARIEPPVRPIPGVVYVLGAIGIASLVTAAGFEVSGFSQLSTLDRCRPQCRPEDVDQMRRDLVVGDVILGVGGISLGVALVLYVTRPSLLARTGGATLLDF